MLNFHGQTGADRTSADSPFSFVCFPSTWTPLFDDQTLGQPLQNHVDLSPIGAPANDVTTVDIRAAKKKRDRHSKIVTSSRPRHRRMRLSIDVARQFFDLQERLGFERASKTVEWLLGRARSDIKKLHRERCGVSTSVSSPSSECEAVSALISADESKPKAKRMYRRRLPAAARRSAFAPAAKRAREIARMKARQRTVEKRLVLGLPVDPDLLLMSLPHCHQGHDQNLNLIEDPQAGQRFYGDLDCHGLVAEEENDNTAMNHEDLYCAFLNADKQHCDQSLLYSIISNDSLQNSTTLPQDQHESSDYQFLFRAWNQVCMS